MEYVLKLNQVKKLKYEQMNMKIIYFYYPTKNFIQKKLQDDLRRRDAELKFFKRKHNELEEVIHRYKNQLGDIPGLTSVLTNTSQSETDVSEI